MDKLWTYQASVHHVYSQKVGQSMLEDVVYAICLVDLLLRATAAYLEGAPQTMNATTNQDVSMTPASMLVKQNLVLLTPCVMRTATEHIAFVKRVIRETPSVFAPRQHLMTDTAQTFLHRAWTSTAWRTESVSV